VLRGGRLRPAPTGPLSLLRSDLLSLGDKVELLRFLVTLPRVEPGTLAGVSVRDWLEGCTRGPAVRRLLAAQARTLVYSTALDLVSAEVLADRLRQALTHPVHYVDGGWQTLADGLRRAAEAAGARIVAGAPVEAVLLGAGRAGGVRLRDGTVVAAGAVVVATSPREAARLVDGDPGERRAGSARPVLRRAVADLLPARLACLDVALCRLPTAVAPVVQDLDRPLFLTTQSGYSRVAPEGGALVYTMKPLDPRREDAGAPGEDERELEGLLDAALPGWRALVVARVFLPRIAAAGALPTAAGGGFAGRPGVAIPDLAGVYLAGDWVGPEGFLADASLASARAAARLALGQQAVDSAAA
jgi:phytoene dehydrogenase-like protein